MLPTLTTLKHGHLAVTLRDCCLQLQLLVLGFMAISGRACLHREDGDAAAAAAAAANAAAVNAAAANAANIVPSLEQPPAKAMRTSGEATAASMRHIQTEKRRRDRINDGCVCEGVGHRKGLVGGCCDTKRGGSYHEQACAVCVLHGVVLVTCGARGEVMPVNKNEMLSDISSNEEQHLELLRGQQAICLATWPGASTFRGCHGVNTSCVADSSACTSALLASAAMPVSHSGIFPSPAIHLTIPCSLPPTSCCPGTQRCGSSYPPRTRRTRPPSSCRWWSTSARSRLAVSQIDHLLRLQVLKHLEGRQPCLLGCSPMHVLQVCICHLPPSICDMNLWQGFIHFTACFWINWPIWPEAHAKQCTYGCASKPCNTHLLTLAVVSQGVMTQVLAHAPNGQLPEELQWSLRMLLPREGAGTRLNPLAHQLLLGVLLGMPFILHPKP